MIGPFSSIQAQIDFFFPPHTHPYRLLEGEIDAEVAPEKAVLDIGCGHGAPNLTKLKGKARELYGIDLVNFDREIEGLKLFNQDVTNIDALEDGTIDLAYSRSVMEHIEDSDKAYSEISRVLVPGGKYIFLTPNMYDYASIIASIVPNKFHGKVVRMTEGREECDTFPTHYQSNSFRRIRQLADEHGFRIVRLERLNQYPSYLMFSRPIFWLGCLYEKVIESVPFLGVLKGWIFCVLEKQR